MADIMTEKKNTKENIVDKSIQLFKENGYEDVTINDICKACGITKSGLYYHFKSKDEILSDYYREKEFTTKVTSTDLSELLSAESFSAQIWKLYEIILEHIISTDVTLLSQFFLLKLSKDPGFFTIDPERAKIFIPLFEKAQASGEMRNQKPPIELYETANHLAIGILYDWCMMKGQYDPMCAIKEALVTLFDIVEL